MILKKNAPAKVGRARIAASNIWEEDYQDGSFGHGLTAHLWITNGKETVAKLRVRPGQEVDIPGGRIRVVAVEADGVEVELVDA